MIDEARLKEIEARAEAAGEIWMPISDFEGVYEVSNLGRVRRIVFDNGTGRRHPRTGRVVGRANRRGLEGGRRCS